MALRTATNPFENPNYSLHRPAFSAAATAQLRLTAPLLPLAASRTAVAAPRWQSPPLPPGGRLGRHRLAPLTPAQNICCRVSAFCLIYSASSWDMSEEAVTRRKNLCQLVLCMQSDILCCLCHECHHMTRPTWNSVTASVSCSRRCRSSEAMSKSS